MVTNSEFIVGMPKCNPPRDVFEETLKAIWNSSRQPSRVIVIDNGDVALPHESIDPRRYQVVRPDRNVGCAGSWNLLHALAAPLTTIILNDDLAVADDTFERMLETPAPTVVLAYGFSCFRIDKEVIDVVGGFDEDFYPAYFEDTDYRRRLQLAGIAPIEWSREVSAVIYPGRERVTSGITHGKHDPDGYQGWRGEKLAWFWERYEANKKRYAEKWGGDPGHETHTVPFNDRAVSR